MRKDRVPRSARSSASRASRPSSSRRSSTASWASSAPSSWRRSTTSCRASSAGSRSTSASAGNGIVGAVYRTGVDRSTIGVMQAKWGLVVAALFCAGCDDPKPTGPSAGRETRIMVIAPHPTIAVGGSQQLSVVITGPDGVGHPPAGPIVWRSSNEAVYAVWTGGVAVALSAGQATISADADGRTADITLRVEPQGGASRGIQGRLTDFATGAPMAAVALSFGGDALN